MTVLAEADRFIPENPSVKRERIYKPAGWLAVGTTELAEYSPVKPTSPEYLKIINAVASVHGLEKTLIRAVRRDAVTAKVKPRLH